MSGFAFQKLNNEKTQIGQLARASEKPDFIKYGKYVFDPEKEIEDINLNGVHDGDTYDFGGLFVGMVQIMTDAPNCVLSYTHGEFIGEISGSTIDGKTVFRTNIIAETLMIVGSATEFTLSAIGEIQRSEKTETNSFILVLGEQHTLSIGYGPEIELPEGIHRLEKPLDYEFVFDFKFTGNPQKYHVWVDGVFSHLIFEEIRQFTPDANAEVIEVWLEGTRPGDPIIPEPEEPTPIEQTQLFVTNNVVGANWIFGTPPLAGSNIFISKGEEAEIYVDELPSTIKTASNLGHYEFIFIDENNLEIFRSLQNHPRAIDIPVGTKYIYIEPIAPY